MSKLPYTIDTIDLSTAAEKTVDGPWSGVRFLEAVDAAGAAQPSAKITVKAERDGEPVPLRLGQAMLAKDTRRWIISWAAQANITATLGFTIDVFQVDWDADPAVQLLAGDRAAAVQQAAVTVGTARVVLDAADANRKSLTIQNLGAAAIYVGDGSVAVADGIELPTNGVLILDKNTAAISAISAAAGNDVRVLAETT